MAAAGSKKELIIELALKNMPPPEIALELRKHGQDADIRYIWKILSRARSEGLPIPKFNRDEKKKATAVERSAKLGSLSEARLAQRREVAGYYLRGFEPAEIVSNGFAPQLDALEIIDLCRDLESVRPPGQWLNYLKDNGYVSQKTTNILDATSQLVKRADGLAIELDKSQRTSKTLEDSNAQLQRDLGNAKDEGERHRRECVTVSENYDKLLRGSATLRALVAKNGLTGAQTLLDRASNVEPLERTLGGLERRIRIKSNYSNAIDAECSRKRQGTEDWCNNYIKKTETKVNLLLQLSGITEEKLETVDSAARMLASDPDFSAGIVREMPDDMVQRIGSRLTFDETTRLRDQLMVGCLERMRSEYLEDLRRKLSSLPRR